jgi:hypothetical protein
LKFLWSCFESWPVVLYTIKHVARCTFAREAYEEILFNIGAGRNGKGVWSAMLSKLLGTYLYPPPMALFTSPPASSESASPMMVGTRGRRLLVVTESEATAKLHSASMKQMRDPTSVIVARNLFKDAMEFSPHYGMQFSSNVRVTFTSADGGIRRSCSGLDWPFEFCPRPKKPNERRINTELKTTAALEAAVPSLLYLIMEADRVFTRVAEDSVVTPRPAEVQEATRLLLADPTKDVLADFMGRVVACGPAEATTEAAIMKAFAEAAGVGSGYKVKAALKTMLLERLEPVGLEGRRLMRFRGQRGGYVTLLPEAQDI